MCPTCNCAADGQATGPNGQRNLNEFTPVESSRNAQMRKSPYAPIGDYLSNSMICRWPTALYQYSDRH